MIDFLILTVMFYLGPLMLTILIVKLGDLIIPGYFKQAVGYDEIKSLYYIPGGCILAFGIAIGVFISGISTRHIDPMIDKIRKINLFKRNIFTHIHNWIFK